MDASPLRCPVGVSAGSFLEPEYSAMSQVQKEEQASNAKREM